MLRKDGETRAKLKDGRNTWEPPDPRSRCSSVPIAWVGKGMVRKGRIHTLLAKSGSVKIRPSDVRNETDNK